MRKLLAAAALLLALAGRGEAQSVQQSGNVTPGHAAYWITNGVIADAGSALNGFLTSLGVVGGPICINSTSPTVNGIGVPYSQLCMQTFTNAAATITLTAYNGATANSINFIINGSVAPANPLWSRLQSVGFFPPFDQVSYVPSQVGRLTSIILDNPSALAPGASSIAAQNRVGDQVFLAYTDTAALQQAAPTCPICTTTAGNNTITMTALPSWVKVGYYVYDRTSLTTTGGAVIPAGTTVQSISGNVVTLSANVAVGGTVAAGDMIVFIPVASQTVANPNTYVCMNPVPAWVTVGMTIADATTPAAIAASTTITGFTGSNCGAGTQVNLSAAIPAAQTVTIGDQLVIAPTGGGATAGGYFVAEQNALNVGGAPVGAPSMWGLYSEGRYGNGGGGQTIEMDSENLTGLAARFTTPNAPFGTGFFTGQPWVPTMHVANVGSKLLNGVFAPQTVSSAIDIISLQDSGASCSPCYGFNHAIVLGLHAIQSIGGNQEAFALASNQQMTWYDATGVTSIASSGSSYTSGTGAVSLTMNASVSYTAGESVVLYGLTGSGASALNGTYLTVTGTTGTTVNVTAASGLGSITITGGFVSAGVSRFYNDDSYFTFAGQAPAVKVLEPGIATAATDGLLLTNTTVAVTGSRLQYSPGLHFLGSGWQTNTGAAEQNEWLIQQRSITNTPHSNNYLYFLSQQASGGYNANFLIEGSGFGAGGSGGPHFIYVDPSTNNSSHGVLWDIQANNSTPTLVDEAAYMNPGLQYIEVGYEKGDWDIGGYWSQGGTSVAGVGFVNIHAGCESGHNSGCTTTEPPSFAPGYDAASSATVGGITVPHFDLGQYVFGFDVRRWNNAYVYNSILLGTAQTSIPASGFMISEVGIPTLTASNEGAFGTTAAGGLIFNGWGTLADVSLTNSSATAACGLLHATQDFACFEFQVGNYATFAPTVSTGELAIQKITASATQPGTGGAKLSVVAGTNANTCKVIVYAGSGTSNPITIVDNVVGGGGSC